MKLKSLTTRIEALLAVSCLLFLAVNLMSLNSRAADMSASDERISENVKDAIKKDPRLSFQGHEVKVTAQNGNVILQGHVASQTERRTLAAKAASIAGRGHVVNQMTASPERTLP